jgi:TM2 domain-containing membrane protein YozV
VDPRRAALLSALWCGLGQYWLGQKARGLAIMVVWVFTLLVGLLIFSVPFVIVVWVWAVYDARATALRLNAREAPATEGPSRPCMACGALNPADFARCPSCDARLPPLG